MRKSFSSSALSEGKASNIGQYAGVIVLFLLISAPALYLATVMEFGRYVFPAVLALPILFGILRSAKIWIYLTALAYPVFVMTSDVGFSAVDFFSAFLIQGGILVWLFKHILIDRRRLVRNIGDWMILMFFTLMLFNSAVALLNGVEFISWLAEYMLSITILLYFPVREHFSDKKELKKLLFVFSAAMSIAALYTFYMYYIGLSDLEYAYQLAKTDRSNLTGFTVGAVFGIVLLFYRNSKLENLYLLLFSGLLLFALVFSLARTNWVILIFDSILLFIFLPYKQKLTMIRVFSVLIVLSVILLMTLLGDYADLFVTTITKRFQSTTQGKKDVSIQSRLTEYDVVFDKIAEHPLGGNGLAKEFTFLNPISKTTLTTANIHNGYFFFMYRAGIPMALVYFTFFFYYLGKSFFLIFRTEGRWKSLSLASFLAMLSIAIANIMSAQFVYRDGYYAIFITVAIIGIIDSKFPARDASGNTDEDTSDAVQKEIEPSK